MKLFVRHEIHTRVGIILVGALLTACGGVAPAAPTESTSIIVDQTASAIPQSAAPSDTAQPPLHVATATVLTAFVTKTATISATRLPAYESNTTTPGTTDLTSGKATPGLTVTQTPAATVDPIHPYAPDPIKASIDFLYSLLRDPSGASSVYYLSQRLRTDIANNWALPTGLGIQPGYNSFEVVMLGKPGDTVTVQATMSYESGASTRDFTLIKEEGNWRIDRIVASSR